MRSLKLVALQVYRLAILVALAMLIRTHHVRLRIGGDAPITLSEVREVFPDAETLREDAGAKAGMHVYDHTGSELGYVLRTMPDAESIIGYRGWTDTLVAFDPSAKIAGVRVRSSQDTREHVGDVKDDAYFMKTWNGKAWEEVAGVPPEEHGIEGVSGATMTSMAMAEGIMRRLASADAASAIPPPAFRPRLRDWGLVAVLAMAMWLVFTGTHGRKWVRRSFQVFVIAYIGFLTGDLLAQSLFAGWSQSGAPWRTAPGLVLLLAAALAIPWTTGKPLYCHHICPHGAAQELLSHISPKGWRVHLHPGLAAGLRWLPPLLLGCVLIITLLVLPVDVAHLEPFDAYVVRTAGWATLTIAITSLVASLFVPMAYCHYGCPTGALLAFVRTRGSADRFGRRDVAALALLAFGTLLVWKYYAIRAWMLADG